MRRVKTVQLGERPIEVRELTVGEVRAWLEAVSAGKAEIDLVGDGLFEDCSFADLARMSDLEASDMDALAPSELRQVLEAARELNADFFALVGRLAKAGERFLDAKGKPPTPERAPPATPVN
jgi:hypothetical protein